MARGGGTTRSAFSARRKGFSLAEILIATAILGVGLAMVMAVFPAAIEQNKDSTADVLGTLIGENGLAILKSRLTHRLGAGPTLDAVDPNYPNSLSQADMSYPTGDASLLRGFLPLVRRVSGDANNNDYQFVIVAYLKTNQNNNVAAVRLTDANFDASMTTFTTASADPVQMGSPVIDRASGAYAKIVGLDPNGSTTTVYLDHPLDRSRPGTTIVNPLVIVEKAGNNVINITPANHVLVARAALRQQ